MKILKYASLFSIGFLSTNCNANSMKNNSEEEFETNADSSLKNDNDKIEKNLLNGKIDIERYAGDWYEIYRYPNWFEDKAGYHVTDVKANYTLKDGVVQVVNSAIGKNGKPEIARGEAKIVDTKRNSKLSVSFALIQKWINYFFLKKGNYWILALDKDYKWAIVGGEDKKYLWVLSREKFLSDELEKYIMKKITDLGYDNKQLIKVKHTA